MLALIATLCAVGCDQADVETTEGREATVTTASDGQVIAIKFDAAVADALECNDGDCRLTAQIRTTHDDLCRSGHCSVEILLPGTFDGFIDVDTLFLDPGEAEDGCEGDVCVVTGYKTACDAGTDCGDVNPISTKRDNFVEVTENPSHHTPGKLTNGKTQTVHPQLLDTIVDD